MIFFVRGKTITNSKDKLDESEIKTFGEAETAKSAKSSYDNLYTWMFGSSTQKGKHTVGNLSDLTFWGHQYLTEVRSNINLLSWVNGPLCLDHKIQYLIHGHFCLKPWKWGMCSVALIYLTAFLKFASLCNYIYRTKTLSSATITVISPPTPHNKFPFHILYNRSVSGFFLLYCCLTLPLFVL